MTERPWRGREPGWGSGLVLGEWQAAPSVVVWSGHAVQGARFSADLAS